LSDVAAQLQTYRVEESTGTWSDVERQALGCDGDLPVGAALALEPVVSQFTAANRSCAVATPLYAALGMTDLTVVDPATFALSDDDSRILCDAADAHLREDGVRLHFVDAHRWLMTSERAIGALTERPEYLIGEAVRPNLPRGTDGRMVERWMNELQMLLFTHPVNIAREDRGLPPINVVWLWGFGSGDAPSSPSPSSSEAACNAQLAFGQALRNGDLPAWQAAWTMLKPQILSADTIVVGDTHPRVRLQRARPSALSRLFANFRAKPTLATMLAALHAKSAT